VVVAVGVAAGLAGALYVTALQAVTKLLGPDHWARPAHLLILTATGVAIGVLTLVLGNPGDVELLVDNIHVSGGRANLRELRSLVPVSLLGIGAGSAIGPEAPLVQTTGSLGSWIAERRHLPVGEARVLAITGMAAGFTVLFGAPLGSAVFALEILHRRGLQYYEALLPAGIGSLAGYAVYVAITRLGLAPVWQFPAPHPLRPVALLTGVAAGVVGAVVAALFTYSCRFFRRTFRRLPVVARPIAGGLVLGGLAWLSPYALTFGESQIQSIVSTRLALTTLLVAVVAKLVASSAIVSSGWRGGFIIPLFFIGASLGVVGARVFHLDPGVAILSMMAAANVGVTKTPFGSALVPTEMAGARMLPPVLLASLVSLFLTSRLSLIETQREREGAFDE
jgi:H+/Cl- antiporter ClcA